MTHTPEGRDEWEGAGRFDVAGGLIAWAAEADEPEERSLLERAAELVAGAVPPAPESPEEPKPTPRAGWSRCPEHGFHRPGDICSPSPAVPRPEEPAPDRPATVMEAVTALYSHYMRTREQGEVPEWVRLVPGYVRELEFGTSDYWWEPLSVRESRRRIAEDRWYRHCVPAARKTATGSRRAAASEAPTDGPGRGGEG